MKTIFRMLALASLAAAPAAAMQQPAANQGRAPAATPHTVHGELKFYEMLDYNGDDWVIDAASAAVRTDWPIRSILIHPGDSWQICARPRFRDCITLNRSVRDANMVGITNQIGSARPAPAPAATPAPAPSN